MGDALRVAVFTVVEVVALVIWLALVRGEAGTFQRDSISVLTGLGILAVGITIEHLLSYNVINKRPLFKLGGLPVGKKLVVSVIETGIWAIWLILADFNALVAAVGLAVLLIFEHSFSDNVFKGRGIFTRLLNVRTVGFSLIEAAGAAVWLALVGAGQQIAGIAALLITSLIEHTMAVNLGRSELFMDPGRSSSSS